MKKEKENTKALTESGQIRPPIVAVMGHIDHGKSTLLDYIRKSNTVDKEAGGITQHLGAYEVEFATKNGEHKKIVFLDTPGHEAFSKMRSRGAEVADIVILVVAADDGVKPQTIEAWKTIEQAKVPSVVAINKIDKPGANVEKVKVDLATAGVYLEGFGGTIPFVPISAKTGEGVNELLDIILLVAEMSELKSDSSKNAEGFVIESTLDPKRGGSSVLIIRDGRLEKGSFIIIGKDITPVRSMEGEGGKAMDSATAPALIKIIGFDELPPAGAKFRSEKTKKMAEEMAEKFPADNLVGKKDGQFDGAKVVIPVVLKADVSGSLEAIEKELLKLEADDVKIKFIVKDVGNINENNLKMAAAVDRSLIIGFNVKLDGAAKDVAENLKLTPQIFHIIYEINPVIEREIGERTPKVLVEEVTGKAKILKIFSKTRDRQIVGGAVYEGTIILGRKCKILRQANELGQGVIVDLQQQKIKTKEVTRGNQFGALIESKIAIAEDDIIEVFDLVQK